MTNTIVLFVLAVSPIFTLILCMWHLLKRDQDRTGSYIDVLEENRRLKEEIRQLKSPSSPSSEH